MYPMSVLNEAISAKKQIIKERMMKDMFTYLTGHELTAAISGTVNPPSLCNEGNCEVATNFNALSKLSCQNTMARQLSRYTPETTASAINTGKNAKISTTSKGAVNNPIFFKYGYKISWLAFLRLII